MVEWHKSDLENRLYCVVEEGKKVSMPRYYRDKIYSGHQMIRIVNALKTKELKEDLDSMNKRRNIEFTKQRKHESKDQRNTSL